jgi:nucleolar protein 15
MHQCCACPPLCITTHGAGGAYRAAALESHVLQTSTHRVVLQDYFGQFGKVTRTRVSRSKRTGKSKGYAFLQLQHTEVAAIAAEAMNGYMMFGHTLRCHPIAPADVNASMFKHANRKMRRKPWLKIAAERHNRERSAAEEQRRENVLVNKDARRRAKIQQAGIEYDYDVLKPRKVAAKSTFAS